jgi:8-oxo-dGTP diphosphatase
VPRAPDLTRPLSVVAGILRDAQGRVLLAGRLHDHPFAGLWEFPGGKIDGAETAEAALRRELREELGIEVVASEPFLSIVHDYPDRSVALAFFLVTAWHGSPQPLLGQPLRWLAPQAIAPEELLPANAAVLEALQAPQRT